MRHQLLGVLFVAFAAPAALGACSAASDHGATTGPGDGGGPAANDPGGAGAPGGPEDPGPVNTGPFSGTVVMAHDTDGGRAPAAAPFRTLLVLPLRNQARLDALVPAMYAPQNAQFRHYLTPADVLARYAPQAATVTAVTGWVQSAGMKVERVAANQLLVEISGTVAAFETAFATQLHTVTRNDVTLYATTAPIPTPGALDGKVADVLTLDQPATGGSLDDARDVQSDPPSADATRLEDVRQAYGVNALGKTGAGDAIGIVAGGGVYVSDAQSFWQSQGVKRDDPVFVSTAEPPRTSNSEATLDVEWAGGIAPGAAIRVYQAADIRDTSLVYAFNEAIGRGEITVLTDSFAHHETSEPAPVRIQYNASAELAAVMGITVLAASGDTSKVDIPSSSPYVTAIGGIDTGGERAWANSGCGDSASFALPDWQKGIANGTHRAVSDLAAVADNLWMYDLGRWSEGSGTSFASPITAGLVAVMNSARSAAQKGRVGFLNMTLYGDPAVQAALRDVAVGGAEGNEARPGWDYPTGWGALDVSKASSAIP